MVNISSGINSQKASYIVFFDLDQTLAGSVSGRSLARAAYKRGFLHGWDVVNAVLNSVLYKLKLRDPARIIDSMVSWVKGMPEPVFRELCTTVFASEILPAIYPEARKEIAFHRSGNARTVILSSAVRYICVSVADALGIDDLICSDLEVRDGLLTGLPEGHICFGPEKALRLKQYCKNMGYHESEAWYYGDSDADIPALSAVGHPVCVNPDRKLKKLASGKNWKTVAWNSN